jgi:RimJ/RimL family protein N-acetyltransferase
MICRLVDAPPGGVTCGSMRLTPYTEDDFDLTVALESDPAVMKDLGGPVPLERIRLTHERRLAGTAEGDWFFGIVPDGGTRAVGIVGVWRTPWEGGVIHELGLMLPPGHQRQRLGARAAQLVFDRARAERAFPAIHGIVAVTNGASNAFTRRLGFVLLGQCDAGYAGRPLRCNHWVLDLS